MKLADRKQIDLEKAKVYGGIVHIANTYTGAKFERPFTLDQSHVLDACVDFIFSYFSMLRIDEIKTAFELALAGKLKDCDIATYYGKFTVQTLSIVLKAYEVLRKQIKAEFQRINDELAKQKTDEEIQARNIAIRQEVKTEYQNLLDSYILTGELDESAIKSFWGKILVNEGIINFSAGEKDAIYKEAKKIVENEIKAQLGTTDNPFDRKPLIKILEDVTNQNEAETPNEDFITKAKNKYSHLIVVKSILNRQ